MTPYYDQQGITIYHGDCREVLRSFAADSADLVLTDPPYNVGKKYGEHNDLMDPPAFRGWLARILGECRRVSRDGVIFFPGTANLWSLGEVLKRAGLRPRRALGWHKIEFAGDKFQGGPAHCWEPVVWASKAEKPYYRKCLGHAGRDFLLVASTHGDPFAKLHPCPKPMPVMRWLVNLFLPDGGLLVDPFAGTGTSLRAAKDAGCRAVGVEVNERFCEAAVRRLEQGVFTFREAATQGGK